MNQETQEAHYEIIDIVLMYRREYIMPYIRQNLPREEAKRLYIKKSGMQYLVRMISQEYTSIPKILSIIGVDRVRAFLFTI